MGLGGWLHGGLSPAAQPGQGLHQGRVLRVRFPFSIQTGFGGSSLWLSLIFGVLPWRAVPVGLPYQQVTTATWLWKDKRRWLNPELQCPPCHRAFCSLLTAAPGSGFMGDPLTHNSAPLPEGREPLLTRAELKLVTGVQGHTTRDSTTEWEQAGGRGVGGCAQCRSRNRLHRDLGVTQ